MAAARVEEEKEVARGAVAKVAETGAVEKGVARVAVEAPAASRQTPPVTRCPAPVNSRRGLDRRAPAARC